MKTVVLALFIITALFIGCTEEDTNPASTLPTVEYTLSISGLPDDLTAVEGTESQLTFSVFVFNQNGRAASGVTVDLSLAMGEGSITPAQAVTGQDGSVEAVCTVRVPNGNSMMQVRAVAGGSVVTQLVNLHGFNRPAALQFFPETDRLSVLPNQNAEILLTAVVTDKDGVGVEGVELGIILYPGEPGSQIFGCLIRPEPTDSRGQATAVFNSAGGSGRIIVRCQVEGLTEGDSALFRNVVLDIELLTIELRNVDLSVIPDYFCIHPDSLAEAMVYARTVDVNNVAVPNLRVQMSTDLGVLSIPTLTDSSGLAVARFTNNHEFGDATIRAWVYNPDRAASVTIRIESLYGENPVLTLESDVRYIYADYGRTVANIWAILKDEDGHVIPGAQIRFASNFGVVAPETAVTDSLGITRAVFTDIGRPSVDAEGNTVPARITATHTASGIQRTVEVTILEQNPVDRITLRAAQNSVQAGSRDSVWVGATCFLSNGDWAHGGLTVYFEADLGRFTSNVVEVTGNYGQAENWYIPDLRVGTATLRAYVINFDSSIVYSNEVEIRLVAGPPTRVNVTADPNNLQTNDPAQYSVITATVLDTAANHVGEGVLVTFATTLGSLNHLSSATDENGQAITHLAPGVVAGTAEITATINTARGQITGRTTVTIRSAYPNSIHITIEPSEIEIGGSATITAMVYDANGNLVEVPTVLFFQLLNEPEPPVGCDINGHGHIDSSITTGGIAHATVNAGTLTGSKMLRTYILVDNPENPEFPDTVSVINNRFRVMGGPPDEIDLDVDYEGVDAGGGVWQIEVSARVFDEYRNPVRDGIPVQFSCDSVATISNGWTGNESLHGRSCQGIAYAILTYHSSHTFDTVTVTASIRMVERTIEASRMIILPLQQGYLTLNVSPDSWMIDAPNMETANFVCVATLRDGHDALINNAPVQFLSSRAYFYWYNYYREPRYRGWFDDPPEPVIKYTGWHIDNGHREHRENRGEATVYLRGEEEDFFLDDVSPEMNVQIGARVFGYEDVEARPVMVVVTRHP